jgi:hypothetical protein
MMLERSGGRSTTVEIPRRQSADLPELVLDNGRTVPTWKNGASSAHPIHRMMARLGSFPPSLARYLILGYSRRGDIVLDPFCGKGTTLVEAIIEGRTAIGSDVAPDAVAVSRAKTSGISACAVERCLDELARELESERVGPQVEVPEQVRLFYHLDTLQQLLSVRRWLLERARGSRSAAFLLGCLLGILHGKSSRSLSLPCAHAYAMAPAYVRRYAAAHRLVPPRRDVLECLREKAASCVSVEGTPRGKAYVYLSSAEKYSYDRYRTVTGAVQLIVTSPPYLDAQTYAKDAWLRLWLLGWDYRAIRPRFIETESVREYRGRMSACLAQMLRALKVGGHAFLVAGDATTRVRGQPVVVRTAEILAEIASGLTDGGFGFEVVEIIDDYVVPHSRYLFPVHRNGRSPASLQPKQERVLHLRKVCAQTPVCEAGGEMIPDR